MSLCNKSSIGFHVHFKSNIYTLLLLACTGYMLLLGEIFLKKYIYFYSMLILFCLAPHFRPDLVPIRSTQIPLRPPVVTLQPPSLPQPNIPSSPTQTKPLKDQIPPFIPTSDTSPMFTNSGQAAPAQPTTGILT